ncbi:uncharacterized protein LOC142511746 [Primulina tabacum]|uniref:uncharacterized protein LOC142511746 n=1 Tax=Primulina tabacum TaxID=48773 RepID=UPI003F5AA71D
MGDIPLNRGIECFLRLCLPIWNLGPRENGKMFGTYRSYQKSKPFYGERLETVYQLKQLFNAKVFPLTCIHCDGHIENTCHAFLLCPFAQECWNESHLSHVINSCAAKVESFAEMTFLMMNTLTNMEVGKSVMIMWCLWKQKNDKLWNNKHCTSSHLVHGAIQRLYDWLKAKEKGSLFNPNVQSVDPICKRWHKHPPHFLKCNTYATIFTDNNTFGLRCILRDENGDFMTCRVQHAPGNPMVKECEVLHLFNAITWIKEMNLTNVIFELDAKNVVDAIKSPDNDTTEFGSLVHQCKHLLNQGTSFSIQFAYRQANVTANTLAKAVHCYASPSIYFKSSSCLIEHLDDYCSFLHDYEIFF